MSGVLSSMLNRVNSRVLAVLVVLVLAGATFLVFTGGSQTKTLTAHFSRTVSIYQGSEVRVMGVNIGRVTAVVPEGDNVRVDMEYDAKYKIPATAKAAIITPTLVADRFVQLAPAYDGGPVMRNGGDIPLAETGVPVELDRIYSSLANLSEALGPNAANRHGALDALLGAGSRALAGNGKLGNEMLTNLSAATQTFGNSSGEFFDTVQNLSDLTQTLAANDRFVSSFMSDLAGVSGQLAGERQDLQQALAALAGALGTVRTFVHDNKGAVRTDLKQLTHVLGILAAQKTTLAEVVRLGPLGLGNLAIAYDAKSASIGSRLQVSPAASDLDDVLCDLVANAGVDNPQTVCSLLKQILAPVKANMANFGAGFTKPTLKLGSSVPARDLQGLVGDLRRGNGG